MRALFALATVDPEILEDEPAKRVLVERVGDGDERVVGVAIGCCETLVGVRVLFLSIWFVCAGAGIHGSL
jgi:hypothetical protein